MKKPLQAALAVALLSTSLAGCQTFDYYAGKVKAAITATDEVIAANQDAMRNVCLAGEYAHQQFLGYVQTGVLVVSAKDLAQEDKLHSAGVDLCNDIPSTLQELLAKIPEIQNYMKQIAAFNDKVSK